MSRLHAAGQLLRSLMLKPQVIGRDILSTRPAEVVVVLVLLCF